MQNSNNNNKNKACEETRKHGPKEQTKSPKENWDLWITWQRIQNNHFKEIQVLQHRWTTKWNQYKKKKMHVQKLEYLQRDRNYKNKTEVLEPKNSVTELKKFPKRG